MLHRMRQAHNGGRKAYRQGVAYDNGPFHREPPSNIPARVWRALRREWCRGWEEENGKWGVGA